MYIFSFFWVAWLCLTIFVPLDIAGQAPLSMGFFRQEYWSGFPFPSPGDLPHPGIKTKSPVSPALQAELWGKPHVYTEY